jgi:hypothetical protein
MDRNDLSLVIGVVGVVLALGLSPGLVLASLLAYLVGYANRA